MKNHFDIIKSLTAFYDTPYYCHKCKKAHTKRDKHKCPSKCLSCFTHMKDIKCEGKEIVCGKCNKKFFGKRCFKNHLKNRSKASTKGEDKQSLQILFVMLSRSAMTVRELLQVST